MSQLAPVLSPDAPGTDGTADAPFTVLVVEDDAKARDLVRSVLRRSGHRVVTAAGGREGIEQFLACAPDLVVCDIQMPDMSGIELLERIRGLSARAEVVMITGYPETGVVIEALRKGASNFVEKPFGLREFLGQLEPSFERCRLRRESAQLQRQLEEERRRRELDTRMATMGRLVAGLAHEIHNPITFLKGNAELLRVLLDRLWQQVEVPEDGTAQAQREEISVLLEDMEFGTRRIAELVATMRRYCAPDPSPRQPVRLSELIADSRKLAEHRRPAGVRLHVHQRDPEVCVRVSAVEMKSCLVNLLVNAYEAFGDRVGQVAVRTALLPYATEGYLGLVEISVEDDGPGIPQGILDEVFTPFFTRKQGGTGLGLGIAFEAAKRNGAQMQIESDEESGTRVLLRLPYSKPSAEGGGQDGG